MTPVAILSFNRADYFRRTLFSLSEQYDTPEVITLFQDGPRKESDQELIDQNVEVFQAHFPEGDIRVSDKNLGVALNYDRAERWAFEEHKAEAAMFFEDDMVVSPFYIQSLQAMLDMALKDDRVGYVACYGAEARLPLERQRQDPTRYEPLRHNWGFGLTRAQWDLNRPYVDQYLEIVGARDYRVRDYKALDQLFRGWGLQLLTTTQDVVKTAISTMLGWVKLNTRACLAQNIGADGLHTTQAGHRQAGHDKVEIYPDPLGPFRAPDEESYRRCLAGQKQWAGMRNGKGA
jgi:hypothetical protein